MTQHTQGTLIWLTGLSGAGKSTLGKALTEQLHARGLRAQWLDSDLMRQHLGPELGFSRADRDTNVRRIGFVASLLVEQGVTVVVSCISPYAQTRHEVLSAVARSYEVFVDAPLSVVIQRDPKGLYRRALAGELPHLTGIGDSYEPPVSPALHLRTDQLSEQEALAQLLALLTLPPVQE